MLIVAALALAAERHALGVWERWAALREGAPPRCFAIAQPVRDDGTTDRRGGFASVAARVGATRAPSVFFRLSRPRGAGAAVTLAVGERRFALSGDTASAHAPDTATDRAIVAAMRAARLMTLTTADRAGRVIADSYTLAGAPTAIDAAQLECGG
ncbi:hypothetical protein ACMGDM_05845 [Sphingomonas sp. DT-51]|uniref:hypothetical protein n=1 Tax=Sphingomonas sp. DT-51 TaxID=3396165 RepID=UPI003F1D579F